MSAKPLRVRVTLSLIIDAEAWANEYGLAGEDVRQDVRDYITHAVRADMRDRGLLVEREA